MNNTDQTAPALTPELAKLREGIAHKLHIRFDGSDSATEDYETIIAALDEYALAYLAEMVKASGAVEALEEASEDYNNPRFTDRRNAGPRMSAALANLRKLGGGQ
jgi:hypothetical protein